MKVSAISNPMLGYKLDLGEPGLSHGAPASRSVLRVLNQELSNYFAFKRKAEKEGGYIISGGIYLDIRKRGSFLAAVAGKTKVWMYIPGRKSEEKSTPVDTRHISDKIRQIEMKLKLEQDPVKREELKRQILLLEIAKNALAFGMSVPKYLLGILFDQTA
ncbi:hypothetical protein XJ44_05275 [Thermosipho affectus]|uniref:Uncharacterized protein n=1 Tax=Thermosipho affectus TaxID=660294 RepID=A0ABX3IH91_9BACT|nr:hypothetical protein [Thermosipho affectus]ONN27196.1 hypothetical protein XJ44_05275 [Thermosipho affectus]